ncbi:MAG TPA: FAD-dependent oxidoreductase [Candidatus Kapabacteria bacterium]|nr:FAD-dependent oxidoreductase [Candidatus Kapabacteria bacterium]
MSRSAKFPFLRSLLRAVNESQLSERQTEQRASASLSRRNFLQSSAIVAGIGAIDIVIPDVTWSQRKGKPKIVIVGAGLAGLTTAYELRKKGIIAQVYEGNSRIGGRVMTVRDVIAPGLITEYGGEFIDTGHAEIHRLARELELTMTDVKPISRSHLKDMLYFEQRHHTEAELIEGFKPIAGRLIEDAEKIEGRYDQSFSKLDLTTLEQYVISLEAENWIKQLLMVAFAIEYGLDPPAQSACNMLSMIDPGAAGKPELYGDSDERYRIRGGNDLLTRGLAQKLTDQIELGHRLASIRATGRQFELTFDSSAGSKPVIADIVVMAIPFSMLRDVEIKVELPPDKIHAISSLGYGSNTKVILGMQNQDGQAPWEKSGYNGALYTDMAIQSGWDSAPMQSAEHASYTVYHGGSYAMVAESLEGQDLMPNAAGEMALEGMRIALPGIDQSFNGRSKMFQWHRYPYSRGSYSAYKPGQWSMQGIEGRTEGQLYFAGEHCSKDYQGFMEGAAETGVKAANAILKKVKK